ncbi:MAG: hypothetical protein V4679_19870 [Pseudomonadota bacterium]
MKPNPKNLAVAAFLVSAMAGAQAADPAVFDGATGTLRMPMLQIDNAKYFSVVIKLLDVGLLKANDPAVVGTDIQFLSTGNLLHLPQLAIGKDIFTQVSLGNPLFSLVSYAGVVTSPPFTGTGPTGHLLDVRVTAVATAQAPITLVNVTRPLSQQEFCSDASLRLPITQSQQQSALAGNWTLKACTFNVIEGTGSIAMTLSVSGLAVPYSATYVYH